MELTIKMQAMTSSDVEAQILRAIMFVIFEDYIATTTAEEFQIRFGTRGTQCLSKYVQSTKFDRSGEWN
jgi:hypothetical protein